MLGNKSSNESDYDGRTHDGACRTLQEALREYQEDRVRRLIDVRCGKVALVLFGEAQKRALDNVYAPVVKVMKQAAVKAFFTGGGEKLLEEHIYKLAEYQDFIQELFHHFIKLSNFKIPLIRFVRKQVTIAVVSEAKFQRDISLEMIVT